MTTTPVSIAPTRTKGHVDSLPGSSPRYRARLEARGWLLFDAIRHTTAWSTESELEYLSTSECVRRFVLPRIDGALTGPLKVFLSIGDRCNLTCTHCYSDSSPSGTHAPDPTDLHRVIESIDRMGTFTVIIGGGEPLLRRDLVELVTDVRTCGMGVSLTTNGTVHDRTVFERLAELHVRMNVSLDGMAAIHDRIRARAGSFDRTLAGIAMMRSKMLEPTIRYTLTNENIADVAKILALTRDLGLPIKVRRAKPSGRVLTNSQIITEVTPAYLEAVALMNEAPHCDLEDIMSTDASKKEEVLTGLNDCGAGTRLLFIEADGTISPCTFLGKEFESGNISTHSLPEIWRDGPAFREMRSISQNDDCNGCSREVNCHGECPAMRLHVGGALNAADPTCLKSSLLDGTIQVRASVR